jgi:O-antigen ligase
MAVAASLVVGFSVAGDQPLTSPFVGVLLLLSYAAIALSLKPERLFIAWLIVAPFFQESSHRTFIGTNLNFALYLLPPLFLVLAIALKRNDHRPTAIDCMPALYLLYVLVSWSMTSANPQSVDDGLRSIYLTIGIGILIYYFIVFGPTTSRFIERIAWSLAVSGIVISLMTIYEAFSGWNLWHDLAWGQLTPPRAVATLANPATLGTFLGITIAFSLAILIWDGPKFLRRLSVLSLIFALPALFLTYTRGPMIAVAAIALCMVFLRSRTAAPGLTLLILIVTVFVASWSHISSSSAYQSRFGVVDTAETRLALQDVSIKLAKAKPVAGWGFGSFDTVKSRVNVTLEDPTATAATQANTSHNTFLTILVELGMLGFLALLAPWVFVAWSAIKTARHASSDRWILVAALGALGTYIISAGTLDMRFFSFVPMLAWLSVAIARRTLADREMRLDWRNR